MTLVYSLSREERSAKCDVVNRCSLKKVDKVYRCFKGTKYQKLLKESCFGHLVGVKDLVANQVMHHLIMRLAMPWSAEAEVFWFTVGREKIRFSKQEFCLISGFLVGNENHVDKSNGKESRLFKKYFPEDTKVDRVKLWDKFDGMKNSLDRYKLGLIVILVYVVWAAEERRPVECWLFELVDNIDAFNKYPWGNESYKFTTHILRRNLTKKFKENGKVSYPLYGFPHAFKVWALEAIPCLRDFSKLVDENALPRMLKWGAAKRVINASVELILEMNKEVEAIRVLVPTEAEKLAPYCFILPNFDLNEDCDDEVVIEQPMGNVDCEKFKELVSTIDRVAEHNKRLCDEMNTVKRKVELLEARKAKSLEKEVGKQTKTVEEQAAEPEEAPVELNAPVTQSNVNKKKRVRFEHDLVKEVQPTEEAGGPLKNVSKFDPFIKQSAAKKMKISKFEPCRELCMSFVVGLKRLSLLPDSQILKLRYNEVKAVTLKGIIEGECLSECVMNDALCEVRRRCKAYPDLFDQGAIVMDSHFAHKVKDFYHSKSKGEKIDDLIFPELLLNYVRGICPEDSKSLEGCNTLYAPVIVNDHWFLIKILLEERKVCVYDSSRGDVSIRPVMMMLLWALRITIPHLCQRHVPTFENYNVRRLCIEVPNKCPAGENRNDTGLFVLKFIEVMLANLDVGLVDSKNMVMWRKKLVAELLAGEFVA